MIAKPGDKFIDPSTRIVYVVTEVLLDGNYAMLTEVDGNHQILMSQGDLKKWDNDKKNGILNIERRNYPRFNIDMPIEYYRIEEPAGSRARTINMSEGGLLIYSSERMEIGQRLRLRLFLNMGPDLNTIELLSEVVWVEIHIGEDYGDYRSGVRFVDISPDDMAKVKTFLMSFFATK